MIKKLVLSVLLVLSFACPGLAQDYYVDAATGNDGWDGKASWKAWATIAGAADNTLYFGDRVRFKQGSTWRTYAAPYGISHTLASEVITQARYILNEATADFWTDAEMLEWVNDGIDQIVTVAKCFEAVEDITLAAGTLWYDITFEYVDVAYAQYETTAAYGSLLQENGDKILQENGDEILLEVEPTYTGLLKTNLQSIGHILDSSITEPVNFCVWNDQIGIDPLPGSTVNGDTVRVFLYAKPYPIVSGGSIPLPAIYDDTLLYYVVAQAFTKDSRPNIAQQFMKQYYESLARFGKELSDRPKEPEEVIK